jgi:YfiH family protein
MAQTQQVHGDTVRIVDGPGLSDQPCDGLVTAVRGVTLCIYTADCCPILLCEPDAGVIAAVHAGWRGTASGIAANAVEAMQTLGARPDRIRAAIGPALGPCCFSTHQDVPDALLSALGEAIEPHMERRGEKWHIDLKAVNALWLKRRGVEKMELSELCTACRTDLFYSFRRHKSRDRQFSMIALG